MDFQINSLTSTVLAQKTNSFPTGEHKLFFLLPILEDTSNVFISDIEAPNLAEKLTKVGINVHVGRIISKFPRISEKKTAKSQDLDQPNKTNKSPFFPSPKNGYDLILLGKFPSYHRPEETVIFNQKNFWQVIF